MEVIARLYMNGCPAGYYLQVRGPRDHCAFLDGTVNAGRPGEVDVHPTGWVTYKGRAGVEFIFMYSVMVIDTSASRFHGASIAGLVVGAMGVFVFTVALRHWRWERRRLREEARRPDSGVEQTQDA